MNAVPSMGCCSNGSKPVFVKTNLGTRLAAVPVSPDITAKEFKRELEKTHLSCFPEFGRIKVNALMVKQKSLFYHLSESLPLKYAFLDPNGTWFLQMDGQTQHVPNHMESLNCNDTEVCKIRNSAANVSVELWDPIICTDKKGIKHERKKVGIQRFSFLEAPPFEIPAIVRVPKRKKKRKKTRKRKTEENWTKKGEVAETHNGTFSESVSVSGIIKKYFSDCDEVASTPFNTVRGIHEFKYLNSNTGFKYRKPEVGTRLLLASNNLGLIPNNQRSARSLCRDSDRKSPFCKPTAVIRNLVFEMTEESVKNL